MIPPFHHDPISFHHKIEGHEQTRADKRILERELVALKGQVAEIVKNQELKDAAKLELQNQIVFLTNAVKVCPMVQKADGQGRSMCSGSEQPTVGILIHSLSSTQYLHPDPRFF